MAARLRNGAGDAVSEAEEWRDIPGHEGLYQASNLGRVRSVDRPVRCISGGVETTRIARGKILKPSPLPTGHLTIHLGRKKTTTVHIVVSAAFIGPRPNGNDVANLNGDPTDNRPSNLSYTTRTENNRHVVGHGRRPLSVEQVNYIRQRTKDGATTELRDELAKELGTNRRHISKVIRRESYAYV